MALGTEMVPDRLEIDTVPDQNVDAIAEVSSLSSTTLMIPAEPQ